VSRNLALHGIVTIKGGKSVEIKVGDNEGDPVFIIPDLLPHLAKDQMKRDASKIVTGEELNLIVGHISVNDKDISEKVKFEVLKYLNEKYGITEHDLITSEIEIVPSENPRDVGFDRALISAYGQDDRVCAFTGLRAIIDAKPKDNTSVLMLFDKEEIGSEGNTGAKSKFTELFVEKILRLSKDKSTLNEVFQRSKVLSCDVTAGADPTFKDVNDPNNCSYLGNGVSIEKYGGGGGKYSTNDASSEYMRYVVDLFDSNNVKWQSGELGRIDLGGGGTIAMYLAEKGCDVIDCGPCVLGMHSPQEVTSKYDVYQAFLGYKAFLSK
jgi:aspartyl aminopeptidase